MAKDPKTIHLTSEDHQPYTLEDVNRNPQDVAIQDQHTPPFQYYLMNEIKDDITLTANVAKDSLIIPVSAGHGFTVGSYIVIMEGGAYTQQKVKAVSTNNITIYTRTPILFTTDATVIRGVIDMNVDGSLVIQEFVFNMRNSTTPIDVQHIHLIIWNDAAAGDDGLFGDLTELTNGLCVRKENDLDQSLGNYRNNSDFHALGGLVEYTDKAGGLGTYGVKVGFDIIKVYGVVIRLDPTNPDIFKATVKDDLSALKRVRISIMGQYTLNE